MPSSNRLYSEDANYWRHTRSSWPCIFLLALALLIGTEASAFDTVTSLGNTTVPPAGVKWSTLSPPVIADSNGMSGNGTDNAAAINALPQNTTIIGDCPAGGGVRIASRWFLKSNFTLYMQAGCKVYCDWAGNSGAGCLTQTTVDDNTIASNVVIDGLYFKNLQPTFLGKALRFYSNHGTFTNMTLDGFCAMGFIRGSDQEWKFSFINTPCGAGTVAMGVPTAGLRHYGNLPKVATTGGKPANVWVHDSTVIGSGDGSYQVAPGCQDDSVWADTSADDYLFEKSYGSNGAVGMVILIGNGAAEGVGLTCINTITNITVRNITGASSDAAINIQNAFNPTGRIDGIIFQDSTIDLSPQSSGASGAAIRIRGFDNSLIQNVTLKNIRLLNTYGICADISAFPTANITLDTVSCPDMRASTFPTIVVRAVSGLTITNSTIGNRTGGAIQLGPTAFSGGGLNNRVNGGIYTVVSPVISGNAIFDITNGDSGLLMQNVTGATVTGNSLTKKNAAASSVGITMSAAVDGNNPGATSSTVTGNNMNTNIGIVCAPPSQGNTVNSNTGAADCLNFLLNRDLGAANDNAPAFVDRAA